MNILLIASRPFVILIFLALFFSNSGAIGVTCSTSSVSPFSLSLACVASVCQATTCISGYHVENGACVKNIDITSDVNNW